jgi:C4-dicarboxylate-specific signal transduction histidine kinase
MKFLPFVLAGFAVLASTLAAAQPGPAATCAAKREAIGRDIEAAKAEGQPHRVRGLERALAEVRRNCSDAKLAAEHQQRVRSQERKVTQRERDLKEAQRKGDADKIARREDKLREAQAELQRVKDLP